MNTYLLFTNAKVDVENLSLEELAKARAALDLDVLLPGEERKKPIRIYTRPFKP